MPSWEINIPEEPSDEQYEPPPPVPSVQEAVEEDARVDKAALEEHRNEREEAATRIFVWRHCFNSNPPPEAAWPYHLLSAIAVGPFSFRNKVRREWSILMTVWEEWLHSDDREFFEHYKIRRFLTGAWLDVYDELFGCGEALVRLPEQSEDQ